ncbi:Glycosyl hydrolase 20, catalytic domain family protein [Candida albicans]|uniref:Beta-hexosaminidase n=1 Tax=Candida albicans TaxID=5476 RepID=A0A8H6BRL0_CANAX|nr:Glycosyl hydrolase 20, catalytic domain family protein [Candida albicans]
MVLDKMIIFHLLLWLCNVVVHAAKVEILPAPQSVTWENDTAIIINPRLLQANTSCPLLEDAFVRTVSAIEKSKWHPFPIDDFNTANGKNIKTSLVHIQVDDATVDLQLGVNESYTLKINTDGINIHAATTWGALHGLVSLQQLIIHTSEDKYVVPSSVTISDFPNFKHRGLMIDSGRNFLTVDSILEQIDIMALSKMNSLHWHLADSQSWPVALESYPHMIKDAYSNDEVYSKNDLKYIVDYARARGVRVIPEIDMPGHARAGWKQVDPTIVECADAFWTDAAVEPPPGQLNIESEKTYEVISNVYNELSDIFIDDVFHVGNDELQEKCYSAQLSPNNTVTDLLKRYLKKALPIFNKVNHRKLTMWDDVLLSDVSADKIPSNITLQVWHEISGVKNLTSRGYDVVVSSSDFLYLDCGQGGSWCGPYKSYQRIYNFDFTANLTETEKNHVLGAEAALWSEQVDSTVLTTKIWPRTAALAELTWSGNKDSNGHHRGYEFTQRILNFREYLVKLGYGVSPLVPKYCLLNPHACDLYKNPPVY